MKGSILRGKNSSYAINKEIGEGGVGTVYKAKNIQSGKTVAVKILHSKRFTTNDIQKQRFKNEITYSLEVESKFIVQGLDHGVYEGNDFLVLEWMANGTLQYFISSNNYGNDKIIEFSSQILKAFRDLIKQGFIHRDIKPNNILICDDGKLKLSDLGITKSLESDTYLTCTGDHLGSVLYITERQRFFPENATHRDDFYAICLVLYELITRKRIHNRNTKLKYLRPSNELLSLSILIDKGMEDSENWHQIYTEMVSLLDIENETLNQNYKGSCFLPEPMIKNAFESVVNNIHEQLVEPHQHPPDMDVENKQLNIAINILNSAYKSCVLEFDSLGIVPWINDDVSYEDDSFVLYFGVAIVEPALSLLEEYDLMNCIDEERLFAFIVIEATSKDELKFSWHSGKRLYIDDSYLPTNIFEKNILSKDEETLSFLANVGRGLAIGSALGAIDRMKDCVNEKEVEDEAE